MKEISLHVLDLAQNSITAGASLIELLIIENTRDDLLVIRLKDNGRGMDEETLKNVADPFFTTRTTRKVGLGISMFKANAELCEGALSIDSELGVGTVIEATFKHSHIDRVPLGNMADTIMTMVMGVGASDIVYKHVYNSGTFIFNTQEVKEVLGDVPLDLPDVLLWIKGFVEEGLKDIIS